VKGVGKLVSPLWSDVVGQGELEFVLVDGPIHLRGDYLGVERRPSEVARHDNSRGLRGPLNLGGVLEVHVPGLEVESALGALGDSVLIVLLAGAEADGGSVDLALVHLGRVGAGTEVLNGNRLSSRGGQERSRESEDKSHETGGLHLCG